MKDKQQQTFPKGQYNRKYQDEININKYTYVDSRIKKYKILKYFPKERAQV